MGLFANFKWRPFGKRTQSGFGMTSTGTRSKFTVNEHTALNVSAFLCGARVISEGFGQVPIGVYEQTENETGQTVIKQRRDHWAHKLLAQRPNSWMTSMQWRELMCLHAVVASNGYSFINRLTTGDKKGQPYELLPIAPDEITPCMSEDFELTYEWRAQGRAMVTIPAADIFHLRGPSWDGFAGMNIVNKAREAIGLAGAIERAQADHFGKGARPSGVLSNEETIDIPLVEKIRKAWAERFGPNGEGGTAILDNGWKWENADMSSIDSQTIESRSFQIEEIGRALRVFPLMMMAADKVANFASASEFFRAHVVHSLGPWNVRGSESLKRDLIGWDGAEENLFVRFHTDGLMQGNPKERAAFNRSMTDGGIFTPNEVRVDENKNPHPDGDELRPLFSGTEPASGDDDDDDDNKPKDE